MTVQEDPFFPKRLFQQDVAGLMRYANSKCVREHGRPLDQVYIKHSKEWVSYMSRCAAELNLQHDWPSQLKTRPLA